MLAIVESIDRFDNNAIAFDYSNEVSDQLRHCSVRSKTETTANEPLRIVQQTRGQRGIQSMASNSGEIRSEEHVRQKFSICSVDQQHLREGESKGRGTV